MSENPETTRTLTHGQVCYLQLPASSSTRAAAFYAAVFGWEIDEPASFVAPGLIGQWVEDRPAAPDAGPMLWLQVADLEQTLHQVTTHGGQILAPPSPDGPDRTLATICDPEGNPLGLAAHAGSLQA